MTNYGYDLSCTDDLTLEMREIDGQDNALIVAQSVYRRLITPRGQLVDDLDYGFDIKSLLHKKMTPNELLTIPGIVKQEILKDERIDEADVKIKKATSNSIDLFIICTTEEEPFSLTISVDEYAAILLEVSTDDVQ